MALLLSILFGTRHQARMRFGFVPVLYVKSNQKSRISMSICPVGVYETQVGLLSTSQ